MMCCFCIGGWWRQNFPNLSYETTCVQNERVGARILRENELLVGKNSAPILITDNLHDILEVEDMIVLEKTVVDECLNQKHVYGE